MTKQPSRLDDMLAGLLGGLLVAGGYLFVVGMVVAAVLFGVFVVAGLLAGY